MQIFRLNTEVYPEHANTWNSYAEALAAKGDTSGAILNYEKSMKINQRNDNARERIRQRTIKARLVYCFNVFKIFKILY
ncbi:MAG: hypothetical protein IID63_07685 [candidate division Zixibacteria bacterium]|nr:hypothetical protein [candidate division Zixibacteria bacterium]